MNKLKSILLLGLLLIGFVNLYGQGGMKVLAGTDVTVGEGIYVKITDGANLLLADNYSTAPSFLQRGTLNFTGGGEAFVEQYLTKDNWHIVAAPVNNEVIGAFMWMYLYEYLEPTNTFNVLTQPVNTPLNVGEGYFLWAYSTHPEYPISPDSTVLNGILNYTDVNLSLSNTDASPKSGWNLLGNPFPCAVDWNGDASWNLNNVGATIYIYDAAESGNYKVWNYNSGGTLNNGNIVAGQGFWVRTADTTGTAASLTIPESQRLHSNEPFYKSSGATLSNQLKLKVAGSSSLNDETIIGFIQEATGGYDSDYDAGYLYGEQEAPSLYSVIYGTR